MKFRVGDLVTVTGGKDKGKVAKITKVVPTEGKVVVEGVNRYVKHIKPHGDQPGQRVTKERALPTANIAILNDKGQPDRIGYKVNKDGSKDRIFKKTGQVVAAAAQKAPAEKTAKPAKKEVAEKKASVADTTPAKKTAAKATKKVAKK